MKPKVTISKDCPSVEVRITKTEFGWMIWIQFEDGYPGLQDGGGNGKEFRFWVEKREKGKLTGYQGKITIEGISDKDMLWMFREDNYSRRIALIRFSQAFPGYESLSGERFDVEVKHRLRRRARSK